MGLGPAAGCRRGAQPSADALPPRPVLGGPGGGRQGAAPRLGAGARACAPGCSGRTQHKGPLEQGHGLGAAGSHGHGNRGARSEFFLHRPERGWEAPRGAGRALPPPHQAGGWPAPPPGGPRSTPPPPPPLPSLHHLCLPPSLPLVPGPHGQLPKASRL